MVTWWSTTVCLFCDGCPEQLNWALLFRKSFSFPASCAYLDPFQQWLWFWDPSFHTRTAERLKHSYYRRFKRSLMLQKKLHALRAGAWTLLNLKIKVMSTCFIFQETCNYHLLLTKSSSLLNGKKLYFYKIIQMWTTSSCSKVFTHTHTHTHTHTRISHKHFTLL